MSVQLLSRPGYAKIGKPGNVVANHFKLSNIPSGNLIHLDVKISINNKECKDKDVKRQVIEQLHVVHRDKLGKAYLAYDGAASAFSLHPMAAGDALSVDVLLPESDGNNSGKRKPRIFKVMLRKVAVANMSLINAYYSGKVRDPQALLLPTMALEVIFRHMAASRFLSIGRSLYTGEDSSPLPGGVEAWRGYYMTVRPGETGLMLNINTTTSAFYRQGPLIQFVADALYVNGPERIASRLNNNSIKGLERHLKNIKVHVTHRQGFKPRYGIHSLTRKSAKDTVFSIGDTKEKTNVASYFQTRYNYRLRFPQLPCIVTSKGTTFPMEVCVIEPNQRVRGQLDEKQLADMIKYAADKPHARRNKINDCHRIVDFANDSTLKRFGLRVDPKMVTIRSRQLEAPRIAYNPATGRDAVVTPNDGQWSLQGKRLLVPVTIGSWAVIAFVPEKYYPLRQIQDYFGFMGAQFTQKGMNVVAKDPPIIYGNAQGDPGHILQQAFVKAKSKYKAPPQVIFALFQNTTDFYGRIKKVAETQMGIITQCMRIKHVERPNPQYCGNMSLKVNKKLGGTNSKLVDRSIPMVTSVPTIIMGADMSHPTGSKQDLSRPSIAAVCGSLDPQLSNYDGTYRVQDGHEDIISDLGSMTKEILINFRRKSGVEPQRIFFYRDGVSDGQFQRVFEAEVKAIKKACHELSPKYNPKLTFIIAKKRHHTRLFPAQAGPQATDRSGNCKPGTVVDHDITDPYIYDFFLQAHAGIQGTCNPVHYVVLYDENNLGPDAVQDMTNRLSYTYSRCSRSVSLVPAVYWAHLLADRARHYMTNDQASDTASSVSAASTYDYVPIVNSLRTVLFYS
ncbi:Piwi domain-containing protein [Syncephalis fuscata]|nr:Piwi domain-containing protein [Syncephalis fuscata]